MTLAYEVLILKTARQWYGNGDDMKPLPLFIDYN